MPRPPWLGATLLFSMTVLTASLEADATIGGARPTTLHVPESYDPAVPAPLILLLHGCPSDAVGPFGENVLRFGPVAEELGILFAAPDGTGRPGARSWGACSGSFEENSAYLRSLIEEAQELFNVDRARIYVVGYSDGGVMAYKMAVDHGDLVAAFVSLAGAPFEWNPPIPVPFLLVGGTLDVSYEGGVEIVDQFVREATWDMAFEEMSPGPNLVAGVQTRRTRWGIGCLPDGFFELWTLPGVGHVPNFIPDGEANAAGRHMIDWLLQHSRGPVPVAAITGVPSVGVAPMEVIAYASGSTAAAGTTIRSACWDFGDDSTVNALTAGHTYEAPGRHLVRLLVISDEGAVSAAVEQPVTVTCPRGELGPWTGLQIGEEVYPGAARFAGAVEDSEFLICGGGSGLLTRRWLSPARPRQSTC